MSSVTYKGAVYPWQCDHIGHMNGTESLQTHRWREMDSNFQYAGAHRERIYDR